MRRAGRVASWTSVGVGIGVGTGWFCATIHVALWAQIAVCLVAATAFGIIIGLADQDFE